MKRDMDLFRALVFAIEESTEALLSDFITIDGFEREEVIYHCLLLEDAGLIVGMYDQARGSKQDGLIIYRLSFAGHDFCDAARNTGAWNETKTKLASTGKSVTFDIFMDILKRYIIGALGFS